jgi:CHAT domain-containing protein
MLVSLILVWLPACVSTRPTATSTPGPKLLEQGTAAFNRGSFGVAGARFRQAGQWFERQQDAVKQFEALILEGQANSFAGRHRRALDNLQAALFLARQLKDQNRTARAFSAMGNVHLALGELPAAEKSLAEGLRLARSANSTRLVAATLNSRGNLYLAQKKYMPALASYEEAEKAAVRAGDNLLLAEILINRATAAVRAGKPDRVERLLNRAGKSLETSEDSTLKAYALINSARLYSDVSAGLPAAAGKLVLAAVKTYNQALNVTRNLNDQRTASYVYGNLARLYENRGQYGEALQLTREAVVAAQACGASESLYQWNWQNGRILARQGKLDQAICAYRLAISDLKSIRDEFSSGNANIPCSSASYRERARKISSEMVDLLLQRASRPMSGEDVQPYLVEARDTLELLKVYELREYFKDDCLDATREAKKKIDLVSARAVIIYPVLLPDRVELLVSFAGRLKRYTLPVGVEELNRQARSFRRTLMKRTSWEFLPHAQKLYDWLIRPLEKDLAAGSEPTLVFVPDGSLRSIPMAALHDGKRFLISRYPIAITPSLILTDPQPVKRQGARLLALGVSQPVQGFPGLPYVNDELKAIAEIYPGEVLLNDQFSGQSLARALKEEPYSIVHIASHGHFGGEVDNTFLLAFDGKLTMDRISRDIGLYRFRREPLDLITLSACETALGDDRAALGLAGIAVRAGARSALATLWQVNDPVSFELVVEFYRQLSTPGCSRATALQRAQLKLLKQSRYEHPGYWAPFLLINNWL